MDHAIAESVQVVSEQLEHWRNLFLGVLQHALRGLPQAVLSTANLLAILPLGNWREQAVARLKRSGDRSRSAGWPHPLTATSVMFAPPAIYLIWRATSNPSMCGMPRSSSTRSGRNSAAWSRPA